MSTASLKMKELGDSLAAAEVKGRSPWVDARKRFFKNKAAVAGLVLLVLVTLFAFFGQKFGVWNNEDLDFDIMGEVATKGVPSIANGHYFGTDELGRDLFARVAQGTRISLLVGVVGTAISVIVGTASSMVSSALYTLSSFTVAPKR